MVATTPMTDPDDTSVIRQNCHLSRENRLPSFMILTDDRFSPVPLLRVCVRAYTCAHQGSEPENICHLSWGRK